MSRSTRTSDSATPTQHLPATGRKRRIRKEGDLPGDTQQQELIRNGFQPDSWQPIHWSACARRTWPARPVTCSRPWACRRSRLALIWVATQKELRGIVGGNSSIAPNPTDKRFADPAWQSNVFLRALLQSYLAGQSELTRFIESTDLAPLEKSRARFVAELLADAVAPSNSPLTNPAALRKLVDTGA